MRGGHKRQLLPRRRVADRRSSSCICAKGRPSVSPEISPGGQGRLTHNTRVSLRDVAKRSVSRYLFWVSVPIALSSRHRYRDKSRGGEPPPSFPLLQGRAAGRHWRAPATIEGHGAARTSESSVCTHERFFRARSPRISSAEPIRSAHLPDQQSYQARNGDGAHGFFLIRASTSPSTAANLSWATAADCDKLSPAVLTTPATWSREEATCF